MDGKSTITTAVKRIKHGDTKAMSLVYNTYVKSMLTLSFRITNNLNDAEDVIQEAFLSSFQKINQLKEPQNYAFWLKRIVVNKSINKVKKKVHFKPVEDDAFPDELEEPDWYKDIDFSIINEAIQQLPSGCREIFTLYLLDGYKHKEIAALFDIAESTSKSQYRYALKLLKTQLKKYRYV